MNRQFKAALGAVKEFIAGESSDPRAADAEDKALRQVVAAELLAAMTPPVSETEVADPTDSGAQTEHPRELSVIASEPVPAAEEQERARQLFLEHGYFDDAVQELRGANAPAERAAAARALGLVGSERAAAHLIAACFDDAAEVRDAAEQALARIGASSAAYQPAHAFPTGPTAPIEVVPPVETPVLAATAPATAEPSDSPNLEIPESTPIDDVPVVAPEESSAAPQIAEPQMTKDAAATEPERMQVEEMSARKSVEELEKRLLKTAASRINVEKEAVLRSEREASLRSEAVVRRKKVEKDLKRMREEEERLRLQEEAAAAAEQEARLRASAKAHQLQDEEARLRLETIGLRKTAADLAQERGRIETERLEAAEAATENEARRARRQAEARHKTEVARLRSEEERLRSVSEEVATRRAEVERAREKAEKEAQLLKEAQERMRAAEEARSQAETQRLQLETELNDRLEKERRLLEESRRRGVEEQQRLEEETRLHNEEEERRKANLEALRLKTEKETKERAELERQILSKIESLRIADAETRRRIEDAETKRRAAEQAYSLVAGKVQRVEAEAHARAVEEQQILAKLEATRRDVATEAQARAEQEKRIKEELELFGRLEEEERPRLEAAILRRTEVEEQFQQRRELLEAEEEQYRATLAQLDELPVRPVETPLPLPSVTESPSVSKPVFAAAATVQVPQPEATANTPGALEAPVATPAIVAYLNSIDPYKRAAAVAELARSQATDAFSLIARCFDDHSAHVRNAAARALPRLEPNRTVDLFNRAMEEGSEERRRNIGNAIAESGLATEAINNLAGESREATYNALSILFVMAKSGEVQPLVRAIEDHQDDDIGKAAIKLLTLSGKQDIADAALRRGNARAAGEP